MASARNWRVERSAFTARVDADRLVIVVDDSGVGHRTKSRQRGSGIGLNNVRARLEHVYGDAGTLQLQERSPAGTRALLVLPQLVGSPFVKRRALIVG